MKRKKQTMKQFNILDNENTLLKFCSHLGLKQSLKSGGCLKENLNNFHIYKKPKEKIVCLYNGTQKITIFKDSVPLLKAIKLTEKTLKLKLFN